MFRPYNSFSFDVSSKDGMDNFFEITLIDSRVFQEFGKGITDFVVVQVLDMLTGKGYRLHAKVVNQRIIFNRIRDRQQF